MIDPSKTETALLALVAALAAVAQAGGAVIPAPTRNENLVARLVEADPASSLAKYLNVLDGDRARPDEMLGADLVNAASYDVVWNARIEFAASGGADSERETAFDQMRTQIWNAIKPDVSSGSPVYLGGAVDGLRVVDLLPPDQATTAGAGLPNMKASEFVVELTYTSQNPF